MAQSSAPITVLFFSFAADRMNARQKTFDVDAPVSLGRFYEEWLKPQLHEPFSRWLFSVNQEWADADTPVKGGDEVAVIPPVSGG